MSLWLFWVSYHLVYEFFARVSLKMGTFSGTSGVWREHFSVEHFGAFVMCFGAYANFGAFWQWIFFCKLAKLLGTCCFLHSYFKILAINCTVFVYSWILSIYRYEFGIIYFVVGCKNLGRNLWLYLAGKKKRKKKPIAAFHKGSYRR